MSWVPRVVGPAFRAFRQLAFRRSARQGAKQALRAIARPKPKPKPLPKKSLPVIGPMPFYRRRRYPLRRRRYIRRNIRKTCNKVHTFVRWCDKDTTYGDWGPNTIYETGANQHLTYQFKLDNVTNAGEFINMYDGYKINKIQLFLEPTYDSTSNESPAQYGQRIRVVHDYNDAFQLSDEDDYLEYGNCKSYFPWSKRGIRITLYPKLNNILENAGGSANAFSSMNSNRQFLNVSTSAVPHFGIKIFIPGNLTTNEALMFRVRAKFWMSMRGTK